MPDLDEQLRTYIDSLAGPADAPGARGRPVSSRRFVARVVVVASAVGLVAAGLVVASMQGSGPDSSSDLVAPAVVELPSAPEEPVAIAGGEAVWVLTQEPNVGDPEPSDKPSSLVRIDPTTGEVTNVTDLPIPAGLLGVAGDSVWITGFNADEVLRVDRQTGDITGSIALELAEPVCSQCEPEEGSAFLPAWMTVAGKSLWVGTPRGEAVAIDVSSGQIERRISFPGNAAVGMAGAGDTLWVAFQDDGLLAVDAETGTYEDPLPLTSETRALITGIESAAGLLIVHQNLDERTPQTVIADADAGSLLLTVDRHLGPPIVDGFRIWIVDQDTLRLIEPTPDAIADPTVGGVTTVGLPTRPAALVDGSFWYLPDDRSVARVTSDGEIDLFEVITDPDRPAAPINVCERARHPTGPVGPDALPPVGTLDYDQVQSVLDGAADSIQNLFGHVEARIVHRDGFVYDDQGTPQLVVDIERGIDDYQIEIVLGSLADCPDAPTFFNRVPITFAI